MTERSDVDPWLTYQEAAAHVGVNHQTIRRAVRRGELVAARISHRLVRIKRTALDEWVTRERTVSDA